MNGFVIFLIFLLSSVAYYYDASSKQNAHQNESTRLEQQFEQYSQKRV